MSVDSKENSEESESGRKQWRKREDRSWGDRGRGAGVKEGWALRQEPARRPWEPREFAFDCKHTQR